jgi:hypothetical protein
MPTPLSLPYPPLLFIDKDGPLTEKDVRDGIQPRLKQGVSLCVRSLSGPTKRGGFFFHAAQASSDQPIMLSTFDTVAITSIQDLSELTVFINHVTGRQYSDRIWQLCQTINLRTDDT